ncbi:MAG: nucleotide exchange factor GrpE [Cyclobacteriaceae bacterium]|nr:nucleotide exchange factor GrpE [Cyclobacteriaceae bacterium]MCH8516386.1 nucleotide exchange factor GrpE [Cyclobacteriaceae bacterium]
MSKKEKETLEKEELNDSKEPTGEATEANNSTAPDSEELASDEEKSDEQSKIEELEAALEESKNKHLRVYSEFENFRRRTAKEKTELIQTAGEGVIMALLPMKDDFQRALKSADDEKADYAALKEGLELLHNKFNKTLESKGLKKMEVNQGSDFDPDLHEAITQIPAPEDKLKGKVIDVVEDGYYLGEKVIRFAKVVIGS